MEQLKSCPFCGSEAIMLGDYAPENWVACKSECQPTGRDKERLIAAWNTRSHADIIAKLQSPEAAELIAKIFDAPYCDGSILHRRAKKKAQTALAAIIEMVKS